MKACSSCSDLMSEFAIVCVCSVCVCGVSVSSSCSLVTCHSTSKKRRKTKKTPPQYPAAERRRRAWMNLQNLSLRHCLSFPRPSSPPACAPINTSSHPKKPQERIPICAFVAPSLSGQKEGIYEERIRASRERCSSTFRPSPAPAPPPLCGWVEAARAFARFAFARVGMARGALRFAWWFPRPRAVVAWCARRCSARSGASLCTMRCCRQSCCIGVR
jgi:hypothetical protein